MDEPINFKHILKSIEAKFWKDLKIIEAHSDFTGPYKKSVVYLGYISSMVERSVFSGRSPSGGPPRPASAGPPRARFSRPIWPGTTPQEKNPTLTL